MARCAGLDLDGSVAHCIFPRDALSAVDGMCCALDVAQGAERVTGQNSAESKASSDPCRFQSPSDSRMNSGITSAARCTSTL